MDTECGGRLASFCLYGGSSQTDSEFYAEYKLPSPDQIVRTFIKNDGPESDGATLLAHLVSSLKIVYRIPAGRRDRSTAWIVNGVV